MICAVKYKAKQLLGATQHTDWKLFSMRRWNRLFFVSTINKPSPLFCLYSLTSAWWTTLADRKSWMPVDSSWQLLKQGLCMKTILMVKPTLEARYIRWNLSPNVLAINLFASSCMCLRPNMMERFHETLPEVRWAAGHFLLCNAFMAQHWAPFFWAIAMLLAGHFPPNGPVSSSGTTKRKKHRCFELLGIDVMLDAKMKPYLIEAGSRQELGFPTVESSCRVWGKSPSKLHVWLAAGWRYQTVTRRLHWRRVKLVAKLLSN